MSKVVEIRPTQKFIMSLILLKGYFELDGSLPGVLKPTLTSGSGKRFFLGVADLTDNSCCQKWVGTPPLSSELPYPKI
jgi:hypothetical protein